MLLLEVVAIPKKRSGSELIDPHPYNTIFNMGGSFRIVAMLSMSFPFALVQSLLLKRTCDIAHAASAIRGVTVQIIDAKKSALVTSLETPNLKISSL